MPLTTDDLGQITTIVTKIVHDATAGLAVRVDRLESKLDRMEGRILTSIELLQRDSFARLDDHERRINKLEHHR